MSDAITRKEVKVKPQRILHIMSSTQRTGGVEALVMNLYRTIDKEKYQFDVISHLQGPCDYDDEIKAMGGRVFTVPLITRIGLLRFLREVEEIIRENGPYVAVHAHTDFQAGFSAWAAKRCGVKNRLCHSHRDRRSDKSISTFVKIQIGRIASGLFATRLLACSEGAALSLYGKQSVGAGKVLYLNNGIELEKFGQCPSGYRETLVNELGIDTSSKLILQVGRMDATKNHSFTIDVIALCKQRGLPWHFLFAGDGCLRDELSAVCHGLDLGKYVHFLGVRSDVNYLMQATDLLLLPSKFEGLPFVLVEAQAAGIPCVVSEHVPTTVDMGLDLLRWESIGQGAETWLDVMERQLEKPHACVESRMAALRAKGFDIRETTECYTRLLGG